MHLVDAGQVVVAHFAAGDFRRAQERQRQAPGGDAAVGAVQRQQQARAVQVAVVQPVHPAQGMGVEAAHQGRRQLDAPAGVVVAGDHHDVEARQALMGGDDEVVQAFLRLERRVDRIEDVAGDQQGVGLLRHQLLEQPGEEGGVFKVPLLAMQGLP
ncbi:hypothetical protein D9M71_417280 [compost metagenome]